MTPGQLKVVSDLSWIAEHFAAEIKVDAHVRNGHVMPIGTGVAPKFSEIRAQVQNAGHGPALLAGRWQEVVGADETASDAYFILGQHVLRACRGHGEVCVAWLLQCEPWCSGLIHDSRDPWKYGREDWIRAEVIRIAGKTRASLDASDVFEPLPDEPDEPAVKKKREDVELLTVAELALRPPSVDLWEGMMPEGSMSIWYGQPKCGKSYLALGLGLSIAQGVPFLGRETRQGLVIYIAGEGVAGLADKVAAFLGQARTKDTEDSIHRNFLVMPNMPALTRGASMNAVMAKIASLGPDRRPVFIVVDTVARALGAADLDENETKDMSSFVTAVDWLRSQTGAAALGVHHSGKNNEYRGSSALRGAADVFARIERMGGMTSRLSVDDMRDGDRPEPIDVTFGKNIVRDGVVRWFVLGHQSAGSEAMESAEMSAILAVLSTHGEMDRGSISGSIQKSKTATLRYLSTLVSQGKVVVGGSYTARTYKLAPLIDPSNQIEPRVDGSTLPPVIEPSTRHPKGAGRGSMGRSNKWAREIEELFS